MGSRPGGGGPCRDPPPRSGVRVLRSGHAAGADAAGVARGVDARRLRLLLHRHLRGQPAGGGALPRPPAALEARGPPRRQRSGGLPGGRRTSPPPPRPPQPSPPSRCTPTGKAASSAQPRAHPLPLALPPPTPPSLRPPPLPSPTPCSLLAALLEEGSDIHFPGSRLQRCLRLLIGAAQSQPCPGLGDPRRAQPCPRCQPPPLTPPHPRLSPSSPTKSLRTPSTDPSWSG